MPKRGRAGWKLDSVLQRAQKTVEHRIGRTPRERLAWAVSLAERAPKDFLPGDLENLRLELAVFSTHTLGPRRMGYGAQVALGKGIPTPSEQEARQIRKTFEEMILRVIRRENIHLGHVIADRKLVWSKEGGHFRLSEEIEHLTWSHLAGEALGVLIWDFGHLVKECPAPAPRGQEGEACGKWFVAGRPNQDYCSHQCRSRATTRIYRERLAKRKKGGR